MDMGKTIPNNLWAGMELLGRFSKRWHRFLRAVPPAFLQQWNFANVPPQDIALAQAIRDIFSLVPRDLVGCIDGLTSEKVWGWAVGESRKIRVTLNDVLVMNDVVCNLPREDVAAQGLAEPDCGFAIPVGQISLEYPFAVVCIYDAITNSLLAARFFNIASLIPEKELEEACKELIAKKDWQKAAALSLAGMREYSKSQKFAELVYQCAEALSDSELADEALGEIMIRGQKYGNPWYVRPGPEQRQQLLEELAAFYNARKWPLEAVEQARVKDIFQELLKEKADPVLEIVYNNFLHNIVGTLSPLSENITNFMSKKILVIFETPGTLNYGTPWIKQLPNFLIDIWITKGVTDICATAKEFSLEDYKIITTIDPGKEYCCIVVDNYLYEVNEEIRERFSKLPKIVIGHSTTVGPVDIPGTLNIIQCSVLAEQPWLNQLKYLDTNSRKLLRQFPTDRKIEVAVSGPHHSENSNTTDGANKQTLRTQLSEVMHIDIPQEKPLLFCLQGTFDDLDALIEGLNRLAETSTVIFKTFFNNYQPELAKLNPRVHIFPSVYQAARLPKMAADFVLSPFFSGSFLSSLIQRKPVIPFYTPVLKLRDRNFESVDYRLFMDSYIKNKNANPLFFNIFTKWPYLFNILDTATIRLAVSGKDYPNWYHENVDALCREILGHFHREDAASITAQYILKYSSEGTLGDECDAVGIH